MRNKIISLAALAMAITMWSVATPVSAHTTTARTSVTVSVGYAGRFRVQDLVPVRVTVRSRTPHTVSGTVVIRDLSFLEGYQPSVQGRAVYQTPLVLPPDATKQATLYMPGSAVDGQVYARFVVSGGVVGTGYTNAQPFGRGAVSVGALTSDPSTIAWIHQLSPYRGGNMKVVQLSSRTFDPVWQALSNFDFLLVNDGSVAGLNRTQLQAMNHYVENGGTLIMVGGAGWQADLRPLPRTLIPGTITRTRTVHDLRGLTKILDVPVPRQAMSSTSLSILRNPRGSVLARQGGTPLVVLDSRGAGRLLYLAFDPSLDPIARWPQASAILAHALDEAAPQTVDDDAAPPSGPFPQFAVPFGPSIAGDLDGVPASALPSMVLFLMLAVLYILLLGPASFLILRRLKRLELLWVSIPLGAILFTGGTFGAANILRSRTVLVNSIGMITLNPRSSTQPITLYNGIFAPLEGDYNMTFAGSMYPRAVSSSSPYGYYGPPNNSGGAPAAIHFQEGAQTQIQFHHLAMWSMQNAAVMGTISLKGDITGRLRVERNGYVVGSVRNETSLTFVRPAVVAGRGVDRLPDMAPGQTVPVRVQPSLDVQNQQYGLLWSHLYGVAPRSRPGLGMALAGGPVAFPSHGGPIVLQPRSTGNTSWFAYAPNTAVQYGLSYASPDGGSLIDRIRSAAADLYEAQNISSLGQILFVAWNQQPLGSMTVNGVAPQRRQLNLVVQPLSATIERGPFKLRTGTSGPTLTEVTPGAHPQCCSSPGASSLELGAGGSATLQFSLPAAGHLRFKRLWLHILDGAPARNGNFVFAWSRSRNRWVRLKISRPGDAELPSPTQFVTGDGKLGLKIVDLRSNEQIVLPSLATDIQISGQGSVT